MTEIPDPNQIPRNLNELTLYSEGEKRIRRRKTLQAKNVTVFFDDLESALINEIGNATAVFGCVAWLTNENILKALAARSCSIIVEKEIYLRPDAIDKQHVREL